MKYVVLAMLPLLTLVACQSHPVPALTPMNPYYQEREQTHRAPAKVDVAPTSLLPCYEESGGAAVFRKEPCR